MAVDGVEAAVHRPRPVLAVDLKRRRNGVFHRLGRAPVGVQA